MTGHSGGVDRLRVVATKMPDHASASEAGAGLRVLRKPVDRALDSLNDVDGGFPSEVLFSAFVASKAMACNSPVRAAAYLGGAPHRAPKK